MIADMYLKLFVLIMVKLNFFDLGKEPIVREVFPLGNSEVIKNGYEITDKCIKCKKCEKICPQKCINDFKINQTHCLHCGLCYEKCPVNAIRKLGN